MNEEIERRLAAIEKRLSILEDGHGLNGEAWNNVIELDLTLPEADIGSLHFNEQKVHAVFDLKEDGAYYSRDILFLSARNVEDDNSRDILTEYLNTHYVKFAFINAIYLSPNDEFPRPSIINVNDITICLPNEKDGIKKYHGVDWWYWLAGKSAGSASHFCLVSADGHAGNGYASGVGGCAPAFRVAGDLNE